MELVDCNSYREMNILNRTYHMHLSSRRYRAGVVFGLEYGQARSQSLETLLLCSTILLDCMFKGKRRWEQVIERPPRDIKCCRY